ncbi:nuclease-related domain-containing protein [Gracilibacillus sp. JCM 18860]|uniref:nuclease-related domain-containing protein n=1 Tax=Gracilibacillus sp. JCM 18860 TaxID=1306159 RepID=UPI000A84E48E
MGYAYIHIWIGGHLCQKKKSNIIEACKKALRGEKHFDSLMKQLTSEHYMLNDLLLKHPNNHFQIDSLMIQANEICIYEIKNYQGDFYYDNNHTLMYRSPPNRS